MKVKFLKPGTDGQNMVHPGDIVELGDDHAEYLIGMGKCKAAAKDAPLSPARDYIRVRPNSPMEVAMFQAKATANAISQLLDRQIVKPSAPTHASPAPVKGV